MEKQFIKSYGVSNNFVKKNNEDLFINKLKWVGKYDGKKADIDLDINNNGQKQHYDIELDNDEIQNLLNVHSVDKPLDNRLLEDFLSNGNNNNNNDNVSNLISYKMPTSVSASRSSSSKRSKSSSRKSKSSSKKSRSSSSKRIPTNVSRLRTSISHSRGSLKKNKSRSRSKS